MTNSIYLLLGTNLGDKLENLNGACDLIKKRIGKIVNLSKVYKTEPWGKTDQPEFYNQVLEITSDLAPKKLLDHILEIEKDLGRIRKEKWGMRLIDIDILYFGSLVLVEDDLIIPHPEIQNRRFTLIPLVELNKNYIHPVLQKTNLELLEVCEDDLTVMSVNCQ